VGRLVIPFARKFQRVDAVDVSPAMIETARQNCHELGIHNVGFFQSLNDLHGGYDLVHSYIVLQHIPVPRGMRITQRLLDLVAPGGACFLHFTIGREATALRKLATLMRKNIKPLHWVLNIREGKQAHEAYMQSNEYNLNTFVRYLHQRQVSRLWLESEDHGGRISVCIAFRAPH
jgi:methylase of polypeptide subunit release factors